jgi:hypothetical protein
MAVQRPVKTFCRGSTPRTAAILRNDGFSHHFCFINTIERMIMSNYNYFRDDYERILHRLEEDLVERSPDNTKQTISTLKNDLEEFRKKIFDKFKEVVPDLHRINLLYWAIWWEDYYTHMISIGEEYSFDKEVHRNKIFGPKDDGMALWRYAATGYRLVDEGLLDEAGEAIDGEPLFTVNDKGRAYITDLGYVFTTDSNIDVGLEEIDKLYKNLKSKE